ncbi:glutathione ABC transporter substrate-binding protein, partial [Staphylococcus sp. SIMBA_130]
MRNYKKGFLLFIVICMMGVLVACADEPGDANGTSGDEQEGAGGDLVIATISDAVTLDPAGSNDVPSRDIQFNIF